MRAVIKHELFTEKLYCIKFYMYAYTQKRSLPMPLETPKDAKLPLTQIKPSARVDGIQQLLLQRLFALESRQLQ